MCCADTDLYPRATYDTEAGHMVEWRCCVEQPFTETLQIPVRNAAKERALTTAARMVRRLLMSLSAVEFVTC